MILTTSIAWSDIGKKEEGRITEWTGEKAKRVRGEKKKDYIIVVEGVVIPSYTIHGIPYGDERENINSRRKSTLQKGYKVLHDVYELQNNNLITKYPIWD